MTLAVTAAATTFYDAFHTTGTRNWLNQTLYSPRSGVHRGPRSHDTRKSVSASEKRCLFNLINVNWLIKDA